MIEHYDAIKTLADVPDHHAERTPERTALVFGDQYISYGELTDRSHRVKNALIAEGLRRQARIAMIGTESESTYELLFGSAKAEMVYLNINWRLQPNELAYIVDNSEAELLFVTPELVPTVDALLPSCTRVKKVIVLADTAAEHVAYPTWRDAHPAARATGRIDPGQPALQVYTSGTTGRPKGVVLSHASFLDVYREVYRAGDEFFHWKGGDVVLLTGGTFHVAGLWLGIHGLLTGAKNVVMRVFTGTDAITLTEKHGVTKLGVVPAMLAFMLAEPASRTANLSSIDQVIYGGSPMPRPLLERARTLLKCSFAQNYGMSETACMAIHLPSSEHVDPANPRLRSAGRPLRGNSVRIVDPEGHDLPSGKTGEIWIKTASHMLEYWKLPDETSHTLVDGWLRTGDAGYVDEDGFVYVTDRFKDLIISAGENISSVEIENVLRQHEAISDVAVIGIPDDRWGELPIAIVVKRPDANLTKADVLAFARKRLASFQSLRTVEFIDALPRNAIGKVLKRVLREPYWAGRGKRVN